MRRALFVPLVAVIGLLAAGCVMPPPPDPEPQLCQPGSFSASGEEPCTPAPVGTFVDTEGATEATLCPVGTYQDQAGQASCINAAPGTFVDTVGAASASLCPPGRYQPNAGAVSCLLAPIGTYVDTLGAIAPTDCPPGTTTDFAGATSVTACVEVLLAVAYSNLDNVDGYDPSGVDVLISKLVDTNLDGLASAGDTVVTNRYPLDFGATAFGNFQVTQHTAASGGVGSSGFPGSDFIGVSDVNGNDFFWGHPQGPGDELYTEKNSVEIFNEALMRDFSTGGSPDNLNVTTSAPSSPDTAVARTETTNSVDDVFIDVDLFVGAT